VNADPTIIAGELRALASRLDALSVTTVPPSLSAVNEAAFLAHAAMLLEAHVELLPAELAEAIRPCRGRPVRMTELESQIVDMVCLGILMRVAAGRWPQLLPRFFFSDRVKLRELRRRWRMAALAIVLRLIASELEPPVMGTLSYFAKLLDCDWRTARRRLNATKMPDGRWAVRTEAIEWARTNKEPSKVRHLPTIGGSSIVRAKGAL
jgi:hypothetical protein